MNITAAARQLYLAARRQPLIETVGGRTGLLVVHRAQRQALTRTTAAGDEIISRASSILREMQNIRRTSAELRKADGGTLNYCHHTHSGAVCAASVWSESSVSNILKCGCICIRVRQSKSPVVAWWRIVDFAIATGSEELFPHLVRLPVYRWHRAVVVPKGHPLASAGKLTLKKLADYPIVTYVFSFSGRSSLPALFETAGLSLDVALTARDSDVIKTYVRIGLGVGILARLAMDPVVDADLAVLDAARSETGAGIRQWIAFRRSAAVQALTCMKVHLNCWHHICAQARPRDREAGDPRGSRSRSCRICKAPLRDNP